MEFDCHVPNQKFYHPYLPLHHVENRIIGIDIENIKEALKSSSNSSSQAFLAEKITTRVRDHYIDSSRLIKRAFGEKFEDDFQMYNWGLSLNCDLSLDMDKLELLLVTYARKMPRRAVMEDFQEILTKHSSFRRLDKKQKREKWLDLFMSFGLHVIRKPGLPDSVGKKQFNLILKVNNVAIDIDISRLTQDMRVIDKYSNRLHMLLVDDPLLRDNFTLPDLSLPFAAPTHCDDFTGNIVSSKSSSMYPTSSSSKAPLISKLCIFERNLGIEELEYSDFDRKLRISSMFADDEKKEEEGIKRRIMKLIKITK